jgi:HemY protein
MIRTLIVVALVAALGVVILTLTGDPGHASVTWVGWRADMTAAVFALIVLGASLFATAAWRTLLWILEAPQRAAAKRAESRRRQASDVLVRGFLACAAGDGSEARRLASKAAGLAEETPGLVRLLAAQAAEAAGDATAAEAAYSAMLGFPEMRLAGHRGLMQLAAAKGDRGGALHHATLAYGQTRTARWAWRALLEARLEVGDWNGGLELTRDALDRKIVPPIIAERARAALLAASAAQLEHAPDTKARDLALDHAVRAARLQPGFAPGVVMAARLLAGDGKADRAAATLKGAWKESPHPALYLAYRDLKTDETPKARSQRLADLAAQNPTHRESLILHVERALVVHDPAAAREAALALEAEPVTARIAGLMARVAYDGGAPDEARVWLAKGMSAPHEPDWSDLDPEGRAFAYHAADWARLVTTFAETGELIHPRHERHERAMSELPDLPLGYSASQGFVTPDGAPPELFPHEAAEGLTDDGDAPPDAPSGGPATQGPGGRSRPPARRRLESAPRTAK